LEKVYKNNVKSVDLCPNDCIAFYDAKHPAYKDYEHDHRDKCPVCDAKRYLTNAKGEQVAAKVAYYFPMDEWLFSNLKQPSLDEYRDNDIGDFPSGHTRHSRGWHEKVSGNPHINCDSRNQAVIGMADGIPIFKDKNSRGVVPIGLRQANQPDSVSKKFSNIMLSGLYPCDYWTQDVSSGLLHRESHKPSNLSALLTVLCDDLQFWYDGKWAVDHSMPADSPDRDFLLRVVLLFWCGDYPGLGEATNFVHSGYCHCHWCKAGGMHSRLLDRMVIADYRRYKHEHAHHKTQSPTN
jgi:hypothetical protein